MRVGCVRCRSVAHSCPHVSQEVVCLSPSLKALNGTHAMALAAKHNSVPVSTHVVPTV